MKFWEGRRVLITGHTGFKGSWLSLWLQMLKAEVLGFSLEAPTNPNLFTLAKVGETMTSIIGDIRDFSTLSKVFEEYQPEIVIHMAAQSLVRTSYTKPIETYATNVMGTVHVLEAARQTQGVKTIINITTDKCYENQEWYWGYRENDTLGGHDPYSNSKACAELVTSAYRSAYFNETGIGLASARAGNVIGGGDWAQDRLIPDIIQAYMNKTPVSLRNPDAIRPWQHVLEPLNAYLLLAERVYASPADYAGAWNFGPDEKDVKSVKWIADFIMKQWSGAKCWSKDAKDHPHEAKYLKLDCSKAKSQLNWQPRWDLEKSLSETISWYQAFQMKENMREKTIAQILNFSENHNFNGENS